MRKQVQRPIKVREFAFPDVLDVIVRQRVVHQQGGFVGGQVKRSGALALGQNATSWRLECLLMS